MNICTGWSPPCTSLRSAIIVKSSNIHQVEVQYVASGASDGVHFLIFSLTYFLQIFKWEFGVLFESSGTALHGL